jgi:hypothetical protein
MTTIRININPKIKLPAADYYAESMKHPAPREPEIWQVEGGGAVLMFPDRIYQWISPVNYNSLNIVEDAQATAVSSSVIDSATLLKAIAIAQNPTLATQLIKE